jgi:hypothetical protein
MLALGLLLHAPRPLPRPSFVSPCWGLPAVVCGHRLSCAVARRALCYEVTYRPQPVAVAVNDPPLCIVPVDRCVDISAPIPPMLASGIIRTRARALGEVGGVDDHFGGAGKLDGVVGRELQ